MTSDDSMSVAVVLSGDCGACLQEVPTLTGVVTQAVRDGFRVRVLMIGRRHTADRLARFIPKGVPILYHEDPSTALRLGAPGTPSAVFIQPGGVIAHVTQLNEWPGDWSFPEVRHAIDP